MATHHTWIITSDRGEVHTVWTRDKHDWISDYSDVAAVVGAFATFTYASRMQHVYSCNEVCVSSDDGAAEHMAHQNAILLLLEENGIEPVDVHRAP